MGWIGAEQGRVTLGRWSSPDQPRAGILSQEQAAQIKRLVVHKKWEIPGSCLWYSLIRCPLKKLATQQKRHCCNLDMGTLHKLFLALKRVQSLGFIGHDRHWFASLVHISTECIGRKVAESVEAHMDHRWKLSVGQMVVSVQIDSELPSHISLLSWSWPQIITTNTHRTITRIISLELISPYDDCYGYLSSVEPVRHCWVPPMR